MQKFENKSVAGKLGSARTWVTTLAVLSVAGAGFAAVGGVEKIRNLIRVSINGEVQEFATDANGEGSFVIDTGNGGSATVNVRRVDSLDDADEFTEGVEGLNDFGWQEGAEGEGTVDVDVTSDGQNHVKVIRSVGPDGQVQVRKFVSQGGDLADFEAADHMVKFLRNEGDDGNVFIRKIRIDGDGEEIIEEGDLGEEFSWVSDDEDAVDGRRVRVIKLKGDDGQERELKFVGMGDDFDGLDIPGMLQEHGMTRVEVGEDGVPTVHIDGAEGADQVIDIVTTGLEGAEGENMTMVKVRVEAEADAGPPKH